MPTTLERGRHHAGPDPRADPRHPVGERAAPTERWWITTSRHGRPIDDEGFTLATLVAAYREVAVETERVIAGTPNLSAEFPAPRGLPWPPAHGRSWSARRVLFHLNHARHSGHADTIRESLDGATGLG